MGAVETEVSPVTPPMAGPDDLIGEAATDETIIDPRDEIAGG
jgi:hypothetical protein